MAVCDEFFLSFDKVRSAVAHWRFNGFVTFTVSFVKDRGNPHAMR